MKLLMWFVYYPLLKILSLLTFWVPAFQQRKNFESLNAKDPMCDSFQQQAIMADLCFEFSSEGEFQQVASLIDDALKAGKKIELVFFSPSVEKAIVNLALKYPAQIRYLRYPLLQCGGFTRWITARKLIMVRYDLFPEFLAWASTPGNDLIMLWMTFKKERVQGKSISWLKKSFLNNAHKIVYASKPDQEFGMTLGRQGLCYDFRIEQIKRRVAHKDEKFSAIFQNYRALKANWEKTPPHKRLIIGNAWPSDLFLFEHLPQDFFVLVVPHKLTPEILLAMNVELSRLGREVVEVSEEGDFKNGDTFILNKKGVLCELYADFDLAYVGGGFEAGVHSILEPLVAGASGIACGTGNKRSTEFDVAHSMGRVSEVKSSAEFSKWLTKDHGKSSDDSLALVFDKYEPYRKDVISC